METDSCLLLAVVVLVGCGKTQEENSMASDGTTKAETKMAVPEKGIPVLMYHMIGDIEDNDAVLKRITPERANEVSQG